MKKDLKKLEFTDPTTGKTIKVYESADKPGCTSIQFGDKEVTSRIALDKAMANMGSTDDLINTLKKKWYYELYLLYEKTGNPLFKAGFVVASIQDKSFVKGILLWLALQTKNESSFKAYRGGKRSKLTDEQIKEILLSRGKTSDICKKLGISRDTFYKVKNLKFGEYENARIKRIMDSLNLKND